ncbi:MAG: M1 family metallopeptidase [Gemmatimonadota bacterium]
MRLIALAVLGMTTIGMAQQPASSRPVPPPTTDLSDFRRLDLPTPTTIRTGSGNHGSDYWQQRADYVIRATLDTAHRTLTGQERITYTNNSPDTLRFLWLQLDQNLFRSTSRGGLIVPPNSRFGNGRAEGGITITRMDQPALPAAPGRPLQRADSLSYLVNGTMMRVNLSRPLLPRSKVVFDVAWSFPFLDEIDTRMGIEFIDGAYVYEVAQWYPRLAVYDDVRGWNTEQYMGAGEFYLEYGSFDVSLTLPANMIVGATGILRNPEIVLTPTQRARLLKARSSDTTVVIRGKSEIDDPASRPTAATGSLTWRFTADSVRDFAWAAAKHFIWDAARANGGKTLVMSLYPPSADSIWNQSTQYGKTAIERYSTQWHPYPYPVAINVNGREGGMEYPMIVFCHNRVNGPALYSVTDHEFGHTWFPMLVGNNERLYPWMDEGFNTFMNHYNWDKQYPGMFNRRANVDNQVAASLSGDELPIMTPPDRVKDLGGAAYNKPGLGLVILRDQVIGPARFDPAFREFIRRWAYRHPTPADFFRTIEDGVGEDLSWFWRSWFYTTETMDQAVDSVTVKADSSGHVASQIYLRKIGPMPMPVVLDLLMDDGFTRRVTLPVEIWIPGDSYLATIPGPNRVTSVKIDPDKAFPEIRRDNNTWPRSPIDSPKP